MRCVGQHLPPPTRQRYRTGAEQRRFSTEHITLLYNPQTFVSETFDAVEQLGGHLVLMYGKASTKWEYVTQLWPGIENWPSFNDPQQPPGTELVTFNLYRAGPGVIFYDFVPTEEAGELIATGIEATAAATVLYYGGAFVGKAVAGAIEDVVGGAIEGLLGALA